MGNGDREAHRAQVDRAANAYNGTVQKVHVPTSLGRGRGARDIKLDQGQELHCLSARASSHQVRRGLTARAH